MDSSTEHLSIAGYADETFWYICIYIAHNSGLMTSKAIPLAHEHVTTSGNSWPYLPWDKVETYIDKCASIALVITAVERLLLSAIDLVAAIQLPL